MISSPGPMFSAIRQASKASVPEDTPTACEQPQYRAIAFSHCSTFGPRMKCCDSITSATRSEEHTSELQSRLHLVCRLLLEKKKITPKKICCKYSKYTTSRYDV